LFDLFSAHWFIAIPGRPLTASQIDGVSQNDRRRTLLAVISLTFAYFAGLFLLLMLASVYEISLRFVLYQGIRKCREKCMWPDKTPLVLKDGETIIAVGKTVKGMAFYIRNNHEDHEQENQH
jgi:hypothetical protein